MAETSSSADNIVTDGREDIAKRPNLDSMMIEAPGRQRYQKVYLWTSTRSVTTKNYKPDEHGPDQAGRCPKLPTDEELVPADHTNQFLEIGLVYGDDPLKDMPKGSAGNKARSVQKKEKTPQRRPYSMMRVFTPLTEYIKDQNKVYIGCHPEAGRLHHYLGTADCVFYYPEFYEGIPKGASQKEFRRMILQKVREAAALNKTVEKPTTAVITADQMTKKLDGHPVVVTQPEHLASTLLLQWDLFKMTKDTDIIDAMIKIVEKADSDLRYGPDTSTDGISAFMNFKKDLTDGEAETLSQELKANYPKMSPDVMLIKQTHAILRQPNHSSFGSGNGVGKGPLGDDLRVSAFCFFVELLHEKMAGHDSDGHGNYKNSVLHFEINNALDAAHIFARHKPGFWMSFAPRFNGGGEGLDSGEAELECCIDITSRTRDCLCQILKFSDEATDTIAEQHGGLIRSTSIEEVMQKLGDVIDKASLQARFAQVAALHASIVADKDTKSLAALRELVKYLDGVLHAIEQHVIESKGNRDGEGEGDVKMEGQD